jgi:DNA-binding CsgD family transcriptional regulator
MTRLSPRQMEVARLVAEDLADKEIAQILRLSIRTVHEYLDRIGARIGSSNSPHARRRAIARWVDDAERESHLAA